MVRDKLTEKQKQDEDQPKKIKPKEILFGCTGTIGEIFPEEKIKNKKPNSWFVHYSSLPVTNFISHEMKLTAPWVSPNSEPSTM